MQRSWIIKSDKWHKKGKEDVKFIHLNIYFLLARQFDAIHICIGLASPLLLGEKVSSRLIKMSCLIESLVMNGMFEDDLKVHNDSVAAWVKSNISDETGKYSSILVIDVCSWDESCRRLQDWCISIALMWICWVIGKLGSDRTSWDYCQSC